MAFMKQQFLGKRKVGGPQRKWDNFGGWNFESLKKTTDSKTWVGVRRGYFRVSGLNSDKVIVCVVIAGVLVCLCFGLWMIPFLSLQHESYKRAGIVGESNYKQCGS